MNKNVIKHVIVMLHVLRHAWVSSNCHISEPLKDWSILWEVSVTYYAMIIHKQQVQTWSHTYTIHHLNTITFVYLVIHCINDMEYCQLLHVVSIKYDGRGLEVLTSVANERPSFLTWPWKLLMKRVVSLLGPWPLLIKRVISFPWPWQHYILKTGKLGGTSTLTTTHSTVLVSLIMDQLIIEIALI